ncbi:hypothetical protein ACFVX3_31100 [Rhodococcus erythropolis]
MNESSGGGSSTGDLLVPGMSGAVGDGPQGAALTRERILEVALD